MRFGRVHRMTTAAAVAVLSAAALAVAAGPASAAESKPGFAPADQATVRPGSMTYTNGGQCTADFVFTDGTDVYLGQAAHCAGTGDSSELDGCTSGSLPLGTPVEVVGASRPGTLAYSSWLSMQAAGEKDPDTCAFNDFALVRLDPADVPLTNPTLPHYGGPVGVDQDGTRPGEVVFGYANSDLRGGLEALRPKTGTSLGTTGNGRSHTVATVPPGDPGRLGIRLRQRRRQRPRPAVHAELRPGARDEQCERPALGAGLRERLGRSRQRRRARPGRPAVHAEPRPGRPEADHPSRSAGPTTVRRSGVSADPAAGGAGATATHDEA